MLYLIDPINYQFDSLNILVWHILKRHLSCIINQQTKCLNSQIYICKPAPNHIKFNSIWQPNCASCRVFRWSQNKGPLNISTKKSKKSGHQETGNKMQKKENERADNVLLFLPKASVTSCRINANEKTSAAVSYSSFPKTSGAI